MNKTHIFDESILRAYDIRGIVGKTLSKQDAYFIGKSFASLIIKRNQVGKICVGFDGRLSSPELCKELVLGITSTGMDVIEIGLCPTPMLYFSVKHFKANGGIMITGSHNPPEYNGFKMMEEQLALFGDDIKLLGKMAENCDLIDGNGTSRQEDIKQEYIKQILSSLTGLESKKQLSIAWDPGNGAAGSVIPDLVKSLPGQHILINEKVDGTFPAHHPDPSVAENLQDLIKTVKQNNCDIGIAFDGDGDRVGVIDQNGQMLFGDQLMMIFSEYILKKNPGSKIIADVKASKALFDKIEDLGGRAIMWKTGHSFIKAKMYEEKASLAGEMSGHIFFADNYGFDDGIYAALIFLRIMLEQDQSLAEYIDLLPKTCSTAEIKIAVSEAEKFQIVDKVQSYLRKQDINFIDIDGVRYNNDNGWWLLRASNTSPYLIVRCESDNQTSLDHLKESLSGVLENCGLQVSI